MRLRKGLKVFMSAVGHKGFLYPTSDFETLLRDVTGSYLPWVGSESKRAVLVPLDSIHACAQPSEKIAVWVSKK